MFYEFDLATLFGYLVLAGIIIVFVFVVFYYLSDFFYDYNQAKADELNKKQIEEDNYRELITQSKRHSLKYSEDFVNKQREKNKRDLDFDINFDVNLTSDSIVKTEVVYVE